MAGSCDKMELPGLANPKRKALGRIASHRIHHQPSGSEASTPKASGTPERRVSPLFG
jgi:hypothetical protein